MISSGTIIGIFGAFYKFSNWIVYNTCDNITTLVELDANFSPKKNGKIVNVNINDINYFIINSYDKVRVDSTKLLVNNKYNIALNGDIIKIELSKDDSAIFLVKSYDILTGVHSILDICVGLIYRVNLDLCNYNIIFSQKIRSEIYSASLKMKNRLISNNYINLKNIDVNNTLKTFNNYIVDNHIPTSECNIQELNIDKIDNIELDNNIDPSKYFDNSYIENIIDSSSRFSEYDGLTIIDSNNTELNNSSCSIQ
jgi:hypothetical protein